jgi:vitamin B12 transporter
MQPITLTRPAGRSFLAFACACAAVAFLHADPAASTTSATDENVLSGTWCYATKLERLIVSASRTPQSARYTPSSVTDYDFNYLGSAQILSLADVIDRAPGVSLVTLGGRGSQASVYIRGAEIDHVLFFVDGVRMNSAQAGYSGFLGGADLNGFERMEILRGPQSTLYGSSAIGGVILLETASAGVATGKDTSGVLQARAGSFDTLGATVAARGSAGPVRSSVSLGFEETNNFRPDNAFKALAYSTRLEADLAPQFLLGATLRGQDGAYDEIGSLSFPGKGRAENLNHLGTVYAQWKPAGTFVSRLTTGWHQNEYQWTDKTFGPASNFYTRNTRQILDWQNTWDATPRARFIAGANAEWSTYTSYGKGLKDRLTSAYLSGSVRPTKELTLEGGLRTDDYNLTSRADTWRTGASYRIEKTGTKLRATYGTGFKAPTVVNRFGSAPFYGASPLIGPEKSKGWDAGFDQELAGEKLVANVTYFQNRFRDLILNAYDMSTGRYVAANVRRARSEGVELGLTARPIKPLTLRAAYTYTSALDLSATKATRLPRRPRHITDLDAQFQLTKAWLLGTGVHFEADRVLNATVRLEDFTTTRLYTSYALSDVATVKFRVENALDESYAEVGGYPSAPRAMYTSVEWKF